MVRGLGLRCLSHKTDLLGQAEDVLVQSVSLINRPATPLENALQITVLSTNSKLQHQRQAGRGSRWKAMNTNPDMLPIEFLFIPLRAFEAFSMAIILDMSLG